MAPGPLTRVSSDTTVAESQVLRLLAVAAADLKYAGVVRLVGDGWEAPDYSGAVRMLAEARVILDEVVARQARG